jgi:hypothetical protein
VIERYGLKKIYQTVRAKHAMIKCGYAMGFRKPRETLEAQRR